MREKYICLRCSELCSRGIQHMSQGEMTEESSSTTSELSVAMTTTGITQITGGNNVTSSSSRGVEVYFQWAVLVIGVVGMATNALILYALVASEQHKKQMLIVHQNILDLFCSFSLAITYLIKLCNVNLTGSFGYWLCKLLLSESLIWWGINSSVINLGIITVERYLKVVHATWSKNKLRNWMIYSAMAFAWIFSLTAIALVVPTSAIINGICYPQAILSETARFIYWVYSFVLSS